MRQGSPSPCCPCALHPSSWLLFPQHPCPSGWHAPLVWEALLRWETCAPAQASHGAILPQHRGGSVSAPTVFKCAPPRAVFLSRSASVSTPPYSQLHKPSGSFKTMAEANSYCGQGDICCSPGLSHLISEDPESRALLYPRSTEGETRAQRLMPPMAGTRQCQAGPGQLPPDHGPLCSLTPCFLLQRGHLIASKAQCGCWQSRAWGEPTLGSPFLPSACSSRQKTPLPPT